MGYFVDCLVGSVLDLGGFATISSYFFRHDWLEQVSATSGAFSSTARTIVSSSESVSEKTSVSASQEKAHTTLQGETFVLSLDFLLITVVHCWLSTRSRWTHMISPWGVGIGTRPFSCWWCGSILRTLVPLSGWKLLRLALEAIPRIGEMMSCWLSLSSALGGAWALSHQSELEGCLWRYNSSY